MKAFQFLRLMATAVLPLALATACTDEAPTLPADELFPQGSRPVTIEAILPAAQFFEATGVFTDYTSARDAAYLLVAENFGGALDAHSLLRFNDIPRTISYSEGGVSRTDSLFTFRPSVLTLAVDTAASIGRDTLRVWELLQPWDRESVSWTVAMDTAGTRTLWTEPGGTRGRLLSAVEFPAGSVRDSVTFPLDTATIRAMSRPDFPGLVITGSRGPVRVQLTDAILRLSIRPSNSTSDTIIRQSVRSQKATFIFSPDVPVSSGVLAVGGVNSARTLLRLNLDQRVPTCAAGGTGCATIPLREVSLNRVEVLLRPVDVPNGFRPLGPTNLSLRTITESGLGRNAPLGDPVLDGTGIADPLPLVVYRAPRDAVVALPITDFTQRLLQGSQTSADLALLSEPQASTFGVAWFDPQPRLRIVYTLPVRRSNP